MDTNHKGRTDFLTVLCVLSLIGSTLLVSTGINQYREADLTSALIRQQMEKGEAKISTDNKSPEDIEKARSILQEASRMVSPEKIKEYQLGAIISNLCTLFGSFLMFLLRRIGFWLYLLGTVAFAVLPFWVYGTGNVLAYGMGFLAALVGLVFVLLYARNLKLMR